MIGEVTVLPFLKWAGGKTRLIAQYQAYLPALSPNSRYFEPFIGSAALFFHLQPSQSILSDLNPKLIEIYLAVQQEVEAVIEALQSHINDHDYYYAIRAQDINQLSRVERAARLIYLNKTGYNGLFRENQKGNFNVPFGRYKNPKICDPQRLRNASAALQGVSLRVADFVQAVAQAEAGDFIYFDPPYVPLSPTSSFTSYNQHRFTNHDQHRLAQTMQLLTQRGCRVMLSQSDSPLVHELYGHNYRLIPIFARRNINSKGNGRGPIRELLILNY